MVKVPVKYGQILVGGRVAPAHSVPAGPMHADTQAAKRWSNAGSNAGQMLVKRQTLSKRWSKEGQMLVKAGQTPVKR